jgi:hypothetical protein
MDQPAALERLAQGRDNGFGNADRGAIMGRAGPHRDGEFVAAQPKGPLTGPHRLAYAQRDQTQQAVTGTVAVQVIDPLEPVEIEQDQPDFFPALLRFLQAIAQGTAIGQSGQRIMIGQGLEFLLDQFAGAVGGLELAQPPPGKHRHPQRGEDEGKDQRIRFGIGIGRDPGKHLVAGFSPLEYNPGDRHDQGNPDHVAMRSRGGPPNPGNFLLHQASGYTRRPSD